MLATWLVALAFCPASLADVALASEPDVVALGAVVLLSELEVDGELDMLPLLLLSLGMLLEEAPALESLGWSLVELAWA